MVHLNVTGVDPFSGTCTLNAWSRHWSGTITTSANWLDSIVVDGNVTFAAGDTLTIQPGTKIHVQPGSEIRFNGQIHAVGTAQNPIVFDCATPNQMWEGLTIQNSNSQNKLEHVIVRHAQHGVKVVSGYAALNHVTTDTCGTGVFYLASNASASALTLSCNDIHNNGGSGLTLFPSTYAQVHDIVENNMTLVDSSPITPATTYLSPVCIANTIRKILLRPPHSSPST